MSKDGWAPKASSSAVSPAYGKAAHQKGHGKGKSGKGKGNKAAGSLEDEQPEEEVAGFYLSAFDASVVTNPVVGEIPEIGAVEWLQCNYDTGCARTVVPISEGVTECGQVRTDGTTYRTASGQVLDDRGAIIVPITDENGRKCLLKARCVDVHKTLISARDGSRTTAAGCGHEMGHLDASWPKPSTGSWPSTSTRTPSRSTRSAGCTTSMCAGGASQLPMHLLWDLRCRGARGRPSRKTAREACSWGRC
jgi:hypothetical protein